MRPTQKSRSARWSALLGLALTGTLIFFGSCAKSRPLEDFGVLPAFSFTTHRDQPFSEDSLQFKVTIANFIFTRCATVCPVESAKMQRITEEAKSVPRIQFASFSVDPEYDSPAVMREFAKSYRVPPNWHFVTGDTQATQDMVEGAFKISMDRQGDIDGVPNIIHGNHFVLIDGRGHIRGYYDSSEREKMAQLVEDARTLVEPD